ncbi:MAG TPA: phosphatidylglycerol lysyltransferase domain-containing protein [Actinomycetales bacterium]|nr:phosphatidylglycerol lysyltransferase domain-containing protein [Actinomycetales bacterium]
MRNHDPRPWARRDRARQLASYGAALLGLLGLVSAISRPLRPRLALLLEIMPVTVPRAAAVTVVLISFPLLLLARGLRSGQRLAWTATLGLLAASVLLHLVKGLDVEESALALAGAVWLAWHRAAFPVLPSRASAVRAVVLAVAGAVVVVVVAVATAEVVERGERLGATQHMARYREATLVALGLGLLATVLWLLLSPHTPTPLTGAAQRRERERARAVVRAYGSGTLDYFALRDDKQWFFSEHSVVAYAVRSGVCVVSPDPIGPLAEREEVWADFMRYAESYGWSVTVIGASPDWLPVYEEFGLRSLYLGDEAVVDCPSFTLEGRSMRGVRQAVNRVRREGIRVTFHDPADLAPSLKEGLLQIATASRRGEVERGFSMTLSRLFDPDDSGLLLSVASGPSGAPVAFTQYVPAPGIDGWSLDVMRRSADPNLPNGVMDLLVVETIRHVAHSGGRGLGLNFSVLRETVAGESRAHGANVGRTVLHRLSRHVQVESLWRFNAKFDPLWQPRYLVVGSLDAMAAQGFAVAGLEGLTDLPVVGRLMR